MYTRTFIFNLYDKPHTIQNGAIKQLIWGKKNNKSNNKNNYNVDIISADNLTGSAMAIPYFVFHKKAKMELLKRLLLAQSVKLAHLRSLVCR